MGAEPFAYTLNIAMPYGTPDTWLEAFSNGLRAVQAEFGNHLAGGGSVWRRSRVARSVASASSRIAEVLER